MATKPTSATLSLLSHLHAAHDPSPGTPSATEIHNTQLAHKPLILRPTSPDPTSQDARSIRRKKRLAAASKTKAKKSNARRLSAKEKRMLGVYDLELQPASGSNGRRKTLAEWSVWAGLFRLWCGYVHEVLPLSSAREAKHPGQPGVREYPLNLAPTSFGPMIQSLDFHGALLRVVKATCSSLVGVWGICVRDTKGSVVLVDNKCVVRRVVKRGAVFGLEVPLDIDGIVSVGNNAKQNDEASQFDVDSFLGGEGARITFELSGSAIEQRPADRATKKFKSRKYDGL